MTSRLTDGYIEPREGDPVLFDFDEDGRAVVTLDRYAVIPMEQYNRLVELAEAEAARLAAELIERTT